MWQLTYCSYILGIAWKLDFVKYVSIKLNIYQTITNVRPYEMLRHTVSFFKAGGEYEWKNKVHRVDSIQLSIKCIFIGSDNGLSSLRWQSIAGTNADLLLTG